MKIKKIIGLLVVLASILCSINYVSKVVARKSWEGGIIHSKSERKNVDLIFVGSSTFQWAFSPLEIWKNYGITSYNNSLEQLGLDTSFYVVKDVLRDSKPKVLVVNVALKDENNFLLQYQFANINIIDRFMAALETYKDVQTAAEKTNILRTFHARWKELNYTDFSSQYMFKGFLYFNWLNGYFDSYIYPYQQNMISDEIINEYTEYIKRIDEYAKSKGVNVVFISRPTYHIKSVQFFKKLQEQLDSNIDYINYNDKITELNIDFVDDLHDMAHMTLSGGTKVLSHLVPYIQNKYGLQKNEDASADKKWASDFERYEYHKNAVRLSSINNLNEWLEQLNKVSALVFIASKNMDNQTLADNIDKSLSQLGLKHYNKDNFSNYTAVINDDKVIEEISGTDNVSYTGRPEDIVNVSLFSGKDKASLKIRNKKYSLNKNGINIIVYDKVKRDVIDRLYIDNATEFIVKRDNEYDRKYNQDIVSLSDKINCSYVDYKLTLTQGERKLEVPLWKDGMSSLLFGNKLEFMIFNYVYYYAKNKEVLFRNYDDYIQIYIGNNYDFGKNFLVKKGDNFTIDYEPAKNSKEKYIEAVQFADDYKKILSYQQDIYVDNSSFLVIEKDKNISLPVYNPDKINVQNKAFYIVLKNNNFNTDNISVKLNNLNIPFQEMFRNQDKIYAAVNLDNMSNTEYSELILTNNDAADMLVDEIRLMEQSTLNSSLLKTFSPNIYDYLHIINNPSYSVFISAKDDASNNFNSELKALFNKLGLPGELQGKYRNSYIGIVNGEQKALELISKDRLYVKQILNGAKVEVESRGLDAGSIASIKIDGVEHSINCRGLNIVIYNKLSHQVYDSVCFDTYGDLSAYR